jgi:4-hydroxybenzoate polyprenyltransferase
MIDKQTIHELDQRARRWLVLYVCLLVATAITIPLAWQATLVGAVLTATVGGIYLYYSARALDAYEDAADELGLKTRKHHHVDGRERP